MVGCWSLLTVFVTLTAVVKSQQCYGVDGSLLDKSYTPCNPGAKNSGCCASGDMCLSNGLCMGTQGASIGMIFSRGCTDPTGKDVACPQQCAGGSNMRNKTNTIPAWQLQTCDSGEYCCRAADSTKSCCNDSTASRITTPLSATLQIPSPVPTATETPQQEIPSPNSAPSTSALPVCKTQNKHAAAAVIVGGILGGILGGIVLGLALTVRYLYKRERRQRRLKEHYETQMSKTNAYRKALETSAGSARPSLSLEETVTKSSASD